MNPFPGRISRPANNEQSTPIAAAGSTAASSTAAFAASMVQRRGTATRVVWIMPVLYSLPTVEHRERRDDRLAEVHAGEADLGRVLGGAERGVAAGRVRGGAEGDGERDGGKEQPRAPGHGAQLRPLGVHGEAHTSRRRTRYVASPRAHAV